MEKRVAYYAHHQGSGHIRHAIDFVETTTNPVLVLSSREFDSDKYDHVEYIQLSSDIVEGYKQPKESSFHYTPNDPKIQQRFFEIAKALKEFQPDVVIVDVSVEVAAFAKLLGYPVIYRLLHGDRTDRAHELAFHSVDKIIAYYPKEIDQLNRLDWMQQKISYIGMRGPRITQQNKIEPQLVTVLTSTGGEGVDFVDIKKACLQTPDWHWDIIGKLSGYDAEHDTLPSNCFYKGVFDEPDAYLSRAQVIISSSGHNAVAQSVAHSKPLLLIPESRPFDEQLLFARSIAEHTDVSYIESWDYDDWDKLLQSLTKQAPESTKEKLLYSDDMYGKNLERVIEEVTSQG